MLVGCRAAFTTGAVAKRWGYALGTALLRVPNLCLGSSVVYAASGCTVLSLLFWERHKVELHISSATPCEHDTVALVVPVALLELSDKIFNARAPLLARK